MNQADAILGKAVRWLLLLSSVLLAAYLFMAYRPPAAWSEAEMTLIRSLWLESLPPAPADPTNAVSTSLPAQRLGQSLFFDTRISAGGGFSCAFCHQPGRRFTDGRG